LVPDEIPLLDVNTRSVPTFYQELTLEKNEHVWSPEIERDNQRYKELYEQAPQEFRPAASLAEFKRMIEAPAWKHLTDQQKELIPMICATYVQFEETMMGLGLLPWRKK
jgi:hypothetical protein